MGKAATAVMTVGLVTLAGHASAAVVPTFTTMIPADHYTAPASTTGTVATVKGSSNFYKSPFGDRTSTYLAVEKGSATYTSPSLSNQLSFVWGTPDKYNSVLFYAGSTLVDSFTGAGIAGGTGSGTYFATLSTTESFNKVQFVSTNYSFELSNVTLSAVPLPATAPLFGAALVGLAFVGRSVKRSKVA